MSYFTNYWKKNKEKILWVNFGLIAFILLLWIVSENQNERINQLKENHLFTIGTIRGIEYQRHCKITAKFTFIYLDSVFVGAKEVSKFQKENSHQIGREFLVIFSPQNPEINYLLPIYADSVEWKNEGWNNPPMNYSTEKALKYLESKY